METSGGGSAPSVASAAARRASGGSVRFVGMVREVEKVGPWSSGRKTGGWGARGSIGSSAMPASSAIQRATRRVHRFAGRTRSSSLGGGRWSPALSASRGALSQASRARYLSLGGTSRSAMAFAGSPGGGGGEPCEPLDFIRCQLLGSDCEGLEMGF